MTQKRSFVPTAPVQPAMTMKVILPANEAPLPKLVSKPGPTMSDGTPSSFKKQSQRVFYQLLIYNKQRMKLLTKPHEDYCGGD